MRLTRFAVIQTADSWRIDLNGEPVARFDQQIDAIRCAADMAAGLQGDGEVEVLLQDLAGEVVVLDSAQAGRSRSAAV